MRERTDPDLHSAPLFDRTLTGTIIHAAHQVLRELGRGFLEKVYENALAIHLHEIGIEVVQQAPLAVSYHGQVVGEYFADLYVDQQVIVEIKAARSFNPIFQAQLLNYLKASGCSIGILLNFGRELDCRRLVWDPPLVAGGVRGEAAAVSPQRTSGQEPRHPCGAVANSDE